MRKQKLEKVTVSTELNKRKKKKKKKSENRTHYLDRLITWQVTKIATKITGNGKDRAKWRCLNRQHL